MVGLENLPDGFGWVNFAQGTGAIVGSPIVAYVSNLAGDSSVTLNLGAGAFFMAGLFALASLVLHATARTNGKRYARI